MASEQTGQPGQVCQCGHPSVDHDDDNVCTWELGPEDNGADCRCIDYRTRPAAPSEPPAADSPTPGTETPGPWTSHGRTIPGVTVAGPRPPWLRRRQCGGVDKCRTCKHEAANALGAPTPRTTPPAPSPVDTEPPAEVWTLQPGALTPTPSRPPAETQQDDQRPRWISGEMSEPWHRDLVASTTAQHAADLTSWAERVATTYGRSGSLEVTAVIWALLDQLDAARPSADTEKLRERVEKLVQDIDEHWAALIPDYEITDALRAALDAR